MTDYEALYRKETGLYYMTWDGIRSEYCDWLKQKLSDRDKLLALSEARFRAAEALIRYAKILNHVQPEYNEWQQAIKAYNEWIQRVTNPQIGLK